MKTRLSILYYGRRKRGEDKTNPNHTIHLICRLTVKGQMQHAMAFHLGMETQRSNWRSSGSNGRVLGKTPSDRHINTQLTKLTNDLTDIQADLERQGKPVTARAIHRLYQNDGSTLTMLELFQAFITEREGLIGLEISKSSNDLVKWRQTTLTAFLQEKRRLDLRPEEFTHNLADKFTHWCLQEKGNSRLYINKMLSVFNQVLRWGVRRELLDKNPMELYKYKHVAAKEIKYLNVGELAALTAAEMPSDALDRARDCFVFQCWTGLAYADLLALDVPTAAEYRRDAQGILRRLLRVTRQKSTIGQGYQCIIPLLPEAERLLAKYEDELPVNQHNGVYNRQLKEVGAICGITAEKMTSHVGRKTAGVMMLNLGIPMEVVSKFLGHSSVKMTEKVYAKILDNTVISHFDRVFGEQPSAPILTPAPRAKAIELAPSSAYRQPAGPMRPAHRFALEPPVEAALTAPAEGQDSRWRRPPPVTSHDTSLEGGRVVPLWKGEAA
jgi:integrase/recombinase XerD